MIGHIVHDKREWLRGIDLKQQPFQELNKAGTGFAVGQTGMDGIGGPIESADDMRPLAIAGLSRQAFLLTTFHPAFA
jgi:hypothetical protein